MKEVYLMTPSFNGSSISGNQMSGRTTRTIEGNHTLCFIISREPLSAPLTITVGNLIANLITNQCHLRIAVDSIVEGRGSLVDSPCVSLNTKNVLIDFKLIDFKITPLYTVWSFFRSTIPKNFYKIVIG